MPTICSDRTFTTDCWRRRRLQTPKHLETFVMRRFASTALLLLPLIGSSCAAVLGVGAGVVISQDMLDSNTFVAQLDQDVDVAWAIARASLGEQSEIPIRVDNDVRGAIATIDGADVTVSVESYDLNRCRLIVSARKYGISNGEIADLVFNRILTNFEN